MKQQNITAFEEILGRKIDYCGDCKYAVSRDNNWSRLIDCKLYKTFYNIHDKKCGRFRISDKIKAMVMLIMKDCDSIGIDIHPRYKIGEIYNGYYDSNDNLFHEEVLILELRL